MDQYKMQVVSSLKTLEVDDERAPSSKLACIVFSRLALAFVLVVVVLVLELVVLTLSL